MQVNQASNDDFDFDDDDDDDDDNDDDDDDPGSVIDGPMFPLCYQDQVIPSPEPRAQSPAPPRPDKPTTTHTFPRKPDTLPRQLDFPHSLLVWRAGT